MTIRYGRKFLMNALMLAAFALWLWAALRWRSIGWGACVWLASFMAMMLIRLPYALRTGQNRTGGLQPGTGEKALLIGMFGTMMVLPIVHLATGIFAFAEYSPGSAATRIGAGLQIPFLLLFWRAHADLGRNWSPGLEVRERHTLVTNGVYAYLRHPMYAAIWLAALTQPLLVHNWIAGALVVPAFAAMWFLRVPQEEAMMREAFGTAYERYCRHVGRLFPKRI